MQSRALLDQLPPSHRSLQTPRQGWAQLELRQERHRMAYKHDLYGPKNSQKTEDEQTNIVRCYLPIRVAIRFGTDANFS